MIVRGVILFGMLILGVWLESRRPLRHPTQPRRRRILVNLSVAAVAAIALKFTFYPVVYKISEFSDEMGLGILYVFSWPVWTKTLVALFALDYTLYLWHQMLHKIPLLWRFHNAHHIDLDLDTSTALRFHFGELIFSTFFRSAQIIIFGINPFNLILFETCITTFAQFHHSNIRIPFGFERFLSHIIVTPRMHGVHHSIVRQETDSNFGTIFTIWDRVHRTLCLNIPQRAITIGVPSYRDPAEQTFGGVLLIPFRRQREWRLPNGIIPERQEQTLVTRKNK